jgi:hypothetical protein
MKLFSIHGLRANEFAALVFMASNAKIADAIRNWCENHENTGNWIVDDPATLIDLARIDAEIADSELSYDAIKLIVQRVELLAESRGVTLPPHWQVIY